MDKDSEELVSNNVVELVKFLAETLVLVDNFVSESGIDNIDKYKKFRQMIIDFKITEIGKLSYEREKLGKSVKLALDTELCERLSVPSGILELVRFLANTYCEIEKFVFEYGAEHIGSYPMIQGTRNQMNIMKIGEQFYTIDGIKNGVKLMLKK